jgi:hypothetical protein
MSNTNELGAIDPTELDDNLEVEIDPTEADTDIVGNSGDEDIDIDTDDDELFKDDEDSADGDDDDEDEVPVKVKKTPAPKKEKKSKIDMDAPIKRVPLVGQTFKSKTVTIEIIGKGISENFPNGCYLCKVLHREPNVRPMIEVGQVIEAAEVAFYSEHYQIVGY